MLTEWKGTFNKSLFDRFLAFARSQVPLIKDRINHLQAERNRIGSIVFKYDKGVPLGFASDPPQAYMGKLLAAYEVLGGNPFHDIRTRMSTDPVFVVKSTESTPVQYMSNGEVIGGKGLADGVTAELMQDARGWLESTLDSRFGSLERKIRRALDYSDQLQEEVDRLNVIVGATGLTGSLETISSQISQLFSDRNYRAVFDDQGTDPFGLLTYAPFSSFDGIEGVAQRQNDGFKGPSST
jgi:hypothetical protein